MKVKLFLKNAAITVVTSVILKTTGMLFKVYLAGKIGSEGMGLFQLVFSFYVFAEAIATTGIGTAVTRLAAGKSEGEGRAVLKKSAVLTLLFSAALTAAAFVFADKISATVMNDRRGGSALKIMITALPFVGLSSCFKGYFTAKRAAAKISLSQIIEQTVRIVFTASALMLLHTDNLEISVAAVMLGDTISEIVSPIIYYIMYKCEKKIKAENGRVTASEILKIALPITGVGFIGNALHTAESVIVPSLLGVFHGSRQRGLELFGAVRGMAMPLIFFPASFLTAVSSLLAPEIAEADALGRRREIRCSAEKVLRTTLFLSIWTGGAFLFFGREIGVAVYGDSDVGSTVRLLAITVPFMYLESAAVGMLKGLNCQNTMFVYNLIDSMLRLSALWVLLPRFGIKGYLTVIAVSNGFTSLSAVLLLMKRSEAECRAVKTVLLPSAAAFCGGYIARFIFGEVKNGLLFTVVGGVAYTFIYASVCFAVGTVSTADFPFLRSRKTPKAKALNAKC